MRQLFTSVIKLHLDKSNEADLKLINTSLKEMRHAFRIFSKYRDVRKVVMWGSSRVSPKDQEYKIAQEFANKISKLGFMVITGGGGGVMEAGNRGAGKNSFGVGIRLPGFEETNPYIAKGEKLMKFNYFFTRKLIFVKESDATALFPGGFGTNDELFEMLTLLQTGKSMPRPIVLVNAPGKTYWKGWQKFLEKEMIKKGFLYKDSLKLYKIVNSVDDAVKEIINFYRVYHSIRYSGPLTILRLNKPLSLSKIKELNRKFKDLLVSGEIYPSKPTPSEVENKEHLNLPRLALNFDRRSYGRLCEMIYEINCS